MNYLRSIYVKIGLFLIASFFSIKLYKSIVAPIIFNEQKVKRYSVAIEKIKYLRDAQIMYNTVNKRYCKTFDELENFIDTARIPVKEIKDTVVTEKEGRLDIKKEKKIERIIGYEIVKDKFKGVDYRQLRYIDSSREIEFNMNVGFIDINGIKSPVFEISIPKEKVLRNLDETLIYQEKFNPSIVRGENIKVGDMKKMTTSGNWSDVEEGK